MARIWCGSAAATERPERTARGTVKLSVVGRPGRQAEGDAGTEFKPRQQPR